MAEKDKNLAESNQKAAKVAGERGGPSETTPVRSTFEWVALAWLALTGAAAAASAYFLFLGISFFAKDLSKIGSIPIRPALLVALALGAGVFVLGRRVLGERLGWPDPRQGTWVRATAYIGTIFLAAFGAYELHNLPELGSRWWAALTSLQQVFGKPILGEEVPVRPVLFPSLTAVLLAGLLSHYLYGRPRWRAFLIETQAELRKVSWPARSEWIGSGVVVLVVVTVMSLFLYLSDEALSWVMERILRVGY